jgi:deoxycytidylate deaminase
MRQYFIDRAIVEAKKSEFKQRHGCIIFKGNRILSSGYNEIRHCNRLESRYTRWINSLHAETRTILFSRFPLLRCSILVIRLNHKDQLVNSKPCPLCLDLILDVGIKNIYYSDSSGQIVKGER